MADGIAQATRGDLVNPLQGGVLDRLEALPQTAPMDDLGLEQVDNRLGERIVVAVPDAAHGGLDPGDGKFSV